MISVLICSFEGSKYLQDTLHSINATMPGGEMYDILVDTEKERTGLQNTPSRYQALWERSEGNYIVKSDDDMRYFPGWIHACLDMLFRHPDIGYISPLNHHLIKQINGRKDMFIDDPVLRGTVAADRQKFISGGCWVFHRSLWEKVPYGNLNGVKALDSSYGAAIRQVGLWPAYLNSVLASHLGWHRHGGEEIVDG